jgi:hypothetical protein
MGLTNEHVGPKILAKIKIYVLTRAELLFHLCYEIPCKYLSKLPRLFQPFFTSLSQSFIEAFRLLQKRDTIFLINNDLMGSNYQTTNSVSTNFFNEHLSWFLFQLAFEEKIRFVVWSHELIKKKDKIRERYCEKPDVCKE